MLTSGHSLHTFSKPRAGMALYLAETSSSWLTALLEIMYEK